MSILLSWLGPLRAICMAIDGVAYSLLDNAYNIVINLSTAELLKHDTVVQITRNLYILFGVVAFFRLAVVLVNSIIDPEKLNEKGKGLSNIFFRVVGMILILAVAPFVFKMSYDLQGKIVGSDPTQNIIFKTILGDNSNISGENAGKALQNIALSSLITIDDNYLVGDGAVCKYETDSDGNITNYDTYTNAGNCGFAPLVCKPNGDGTCTPQGGYIYDDSVCDWKNCHNAVDLYNQMYVAENMQPSKLAVYAGVSEKLDIDGTEEEVYVYDYMMIVTAGVGIFMTYIIISFAIDIAVRMFELLVLEILSPLFIATFVDPKSAQSGPFKNWLSALGKSYVSLYIKLAILALMIFLVSIINQSNIFNAMGDVGGMAKIFVVIGLLIFAKKAPKWIMDIIGIKGDESGLGGLSIGKKLGGMALAGGLISKGLEAGKKFAGQKAKNFGANRIRNTAARIGGMKEAHRENKANKKLGIPDRKSLWNAGRAAAKNSRHANWGAESQGLFKDIAQGYMGGRLNFNPDAQTLNEHFKAKANKKALDFNAKIGNSAEAFEKKKDAVPKMKKAMQMRRKNVELTKTGERDTVKSWQGYNEFKAAIGDNVLTEDKAYLKDMENNGLYDSSSGKFTINGKTYTDKAEAIKVYKDTFTGAGQRDITAYVTKNFESANNSLKANIELRSENDQKMAEYNAKIAELKKSGVSDGDPAIVSLDNLAKQLKDQNDKINADSTSIINNLINSEATFTNAPHKCPSAVQVGEDYVTLVGKFEKQKDGTFVYKANAKASDSTTYNFDPTTVTGIMNKLSSTASSKEKDADKAHEALEPKSN